MFRPCSTGGVVNAVTKSGSNEFEFGGNIYYRPDSLRKDAPDSFKSTGAPFIINNQDERDEVDGNIFASGPIIKDTLFFYAIYNPKSYERQDVISEGSQFRVRDEEDAFWGVKLDWQITDNHLLEYLTFSDTNDQVDRTYSYDSDSGERDALQSTATTKSGGENYSFKYTGYLTDDLVVSALYGENKYDVSSLADNQEACNLVYDTRAEAPHGLSIGCATASDYFVEVGEDTREALRFDVEYYVGNHTIRAGFDMETNTSFSQQKYSGLGDGSYWFIYDGVPGTQIVPGVFVPEGVDSYTRERIRTVGGSFETKASALYIEDTWSVTDTVTLTLGLRNETFDNKNSNGETFVKIDDMIAPRVGASWDINGDGESKVFANVGRYFLPVANNTNVRLSGNEYDVYNYYYFDGLQEGDYNGIPYYTPIVGDKFGSQTNAAGVVPDTTVIVDQDLDPMYQDEFVLGYQTYLTEDWSAGIRGIRRVLNGAIDDMLIDHYTEEKYGCGHVDHNYVLGNPGEDMDVNVDTNCDGVGDGVITIPGADLGYPVAERKYNAVEVTFARQWDGVWNLNGSYTWSHSYGNTEGLVKSDNGQDDAGITTDFDFVELTDGAYGDLANDRRHMFKVWGAYALTEELVVSANFSIQSGRPRNAFGVGHPNVNGGVDYGQTYYLCASGCDTDDKNWTYMPRGTYGRTDWVNRLDLAATYTTDFDGTEVQFRAEVFNVLEGESVTYYEEDLEQSLGDLDPNFGAASQWQTPRYAQLSASVKF